jgi:hypothetical protein
VLGIVFLTSLNRAGMSMATMKDAVEVVTMAQGGIMKASKAAAGDR